MATVKIVVRARAGRKRATRAESLELELAALAKAGLEGRELLVAAAKVVLNHLDYGRGFPAKFGAGSASLKAVLAASGPYPDAAAFFGQCRTAAEHKRAEGGEKPLEREAQRVVARFLEEGGTPS